MSDNQDGCERMTVSSGTDQQPLHSIGSQAKLLGDAEMLPSQMPSLHRLLHHQVYQASWY